MTLFFGDHFKERIKYKKNKIRLNSSDAFGSGAHPTTEGCIKAIKFINKKIKINSFLDIGSGSGILSICASKYWKNAQIYGVDIDKTSIIRSRLNIKNNNLKSRIRFELMHPKTSLNFKYKSEFDLVVANIITSELSLLARYIEKKIKKNGYLVLSGILDYQLKIILSKFRNFNLILNKKIYISSWVTIILKRSHTIMNQNTCLSKFRNALKMNNLDAYIQPRSDMFGGEEVPDYDARLKFLSGFTGSAGIAVITLKKAILFTDGRVYTPS